MPRWNPCSVCAEFKIVHFRPYAKNTPRGTGGKGLMGMTPTPNVSIYMIILMSFVSYL